MEDQNLEFEYSENKIDQALKLYDTELNDEQVAKEVTTLLKKQLKEIALLEEEYTIEITNCWLTIKQKKLSIIKKNLV